MALLYNNDAKFEYMEVNRHWDASSEKYAGADSLLTAMNKGWKPAETAYVEEFWLAGSRLVTVFHFDLVRGDEQMSMPVLSNPYLRRVVPRITRTVIPVSERDMIHRKTTNGNRA